MAPDVWRRMAKALRKEIAYSEKKQNTKKKLCAQTNQDLPKGSRPKEWRQEYPADDNGAKETTGGNQAALGK